MLKSLLQFIAIFIICFMFSPNFSYPEETADTSSFIRSHTSGGVNIRLRDEYWSTFERQGTPTDNSYNFFLIRARAFVDLKFENLMFHLMGQGVKGFDFPNDSPFGPGGLYFSASGNDTGPGNFQIGEAFISYKDPGGVYLKGGRIPIRDGAEVLYKDAKKLNWVIKKRLAERLIGTWDWTNIGRRFDGGTAGYANDNVDVNLFGSYVTFGGFDFDDGLWKELDDVVVGGGSLTLKKDFILPNTQFKVFSYFYYDDRNPAIARAGDDIKIYTIGANLAGAYEVGSGELDLLLWFAYQFGDFGNLDQQAYAFIGEVGYQFLNAPLKPWLRLGFAYASGDDDPNDGDNGTFFNMVPTNHKWYGSMDANAFSNLADAYFQLFLKPHSKVGLSVDGHLFWLASDDEVWIGGSGPFNNSVFGYAFRNPIEGNNIEKDLGGEIDVAMTFNALDFLTFHIGYSHFFGSDGVEVVFDKEDQMDWFYAQANIHFNVGK